MAQPRTARSPFAALAPIMVGVAVASAAIAFLVVMVLPGGGQVEVDAELPDATSIEIPGHGHETMIRDGAPAAERILAWLDRG